MANPKQLIATLFKKTIKWLFYFLLLLTLILVIAYWTAPYWVPSQIQSFLPEQLKVKNLSLERPGLRSAFVKQLELEVNAESNIVLNLENIELSYSLIQKKLTALKAEKAFVAIGSDEDTAGKEFSNQLAIPDIPLERIEIKEATVAGLFIQDLDFKNLSLVNSNDNLRLTSDLEFIGLALRLDSSLKYSDGFLSQLTSDIQQGDDTIHLTLAPVQFSKTAFDWAIASQLDSNNYYPIDGLSTIKLKGSGVFDIGNSVQLTLNEDFSLDAPFALAELEVKTTVKNLLYDKGIKLDLSVLENPIHTAITTSERTEIILDPKTYLITLQKGSLQVANKHPLTEQLITITQLELNPNVALSDPEQSVAGNLLSHTKLSQLQYRQDTLSLETQDLNIQFSAPFTITNSNLSLQTQNLAIQLGETHFKDSAIRTQINATQWQGSAEISQNLVGNDTANSKVIKLQQHKPIKLSLKIHTDTLKFQQLSNNLSFNGNFLSINSKASKAHFTEQDLKLNQLTGTTKLNINNNRINGTAKVVSASFNNEQVSISPMATEFNWLKAGNNLQANGHLFYLTSKIPFDYRINLNQESHKINISPLNLDALDISQWLTPILQQYPALAIEQGKISSPIISGNPFDLAFDGDVKLRNLNLSYDQLKIINLQLDESLNSSSPLGGTTNGSIEKIEVATGIDITQLQFFLTHKIDSFNFSDIYGQLLKGSLYIPSLIITPKDIKPFTAHLNRIDFGQLLKSLEAESLTIEGIFDFKLPIQISANSQTISNGTFNSVDKGILRVDSGESADTNIAFQALQNFHYEEFSGIINYSDQGIYQLDILLKGANPDLYDGFPIELKMKVEGNLPNLLYSMLISGDMAKPIIEKYQSGELDLPKKPSPK